MMADDSARKFAPLPNCDGLELLRQLNLTQAELASLSAQGFVSVEHRSSGIYYKLRFRCGGRQIVRGLGNCSRHAEEVRRALDVYQHKTRARQQLRQSVARAARLLRESRRLLNPVLVEVGFYFHGSEIRRRQTDVIRTASCESRTEIENAGEKVIAGGQSDTEEHERDQFGNQLDRPGIRRRSSSQRDISERVDAAVTEATESDSKTSGVGARFAGHASSVSRPGCERPARNVSRTQAGARRKPRAGCRSFGPTPDADAGSANLSEDRSANRTFGSIGCAAGGARWQACRIAGAASWTVLPANGLQRRNGDLIPGRTTVLRPRGHPLLNDETSLHSTMNRRDSHG